jgi:predicted DNA binding CopG/RHH family protein
MDAPMAMTAKAVADDQTSKALDENICVRVASTLIARSQFSADPAKHHYAMFVDLPQCTNLRGSGESMGAAFVDFCGQLSKIVFPEVGSDRTISQQVLERAVQSLAAARASTVEKSRTKVRQKSVGVSSTDTLIEMVKQAASERGVPLSEVSRSLFERGFEELDRRLNKESSRKVLEEFQLAYTNLPGSDAPQWMLRVSPALYGRLRVFAHEHKKSLSSVAAMCIAYSLQKHLI